jgi:ABC-type multidrug transport system fused ATPase/permease subunit
MASFQRFNPLPVQAGNIDDWRVRHRRQAELRRQIGFVADEDSLFAGKLSQIIRIGRRQRLAGVEDVQD